MPQRPIELQMMAMDQSVVRPGLLVLPIDDQFVVFSEDKQRLISLNASAGTVLSELQKGTPVKHLAAALVSSGAATPDVADEWVETTLKGLREQGFLVGVQGLNFEGDTKDGEESATPPYRPINGKFVPVAEHYYELLGTRAKIRFEHEAQVRLVNSVIGHLATKETSGVTLNIDVQAVPLNNGHLLSNTFVNGTAFSHAPRLSKLGPIVKAALWQSAVKAHDHFLYIHAGVVASGDRCIILPAAAGSGKSSLTAALVHAGYRYYSDEAVLLERDSFLVPPMALAICCKASGWELMTHYFPSIMDLPVHLREDGKYVRYVPPPPGSSKQPSLPVSHIVFPRYSELAKTNVERLSPAAALSRLMGECLATGQRLSNKNVAALVRWIEAIACYDLTFSSLDQAVERIRGIESQKSH